VTSLMMALSVLASLFAVRLRARLGLAPILLLAFGLQIALAGVLSLTNSALAIAFCSLFLASGAASERDLMAYSEIQTILAVYAGVGLALLGALAWASRRLSIDAEG